MEKGEARKSQVSRGGLGGREGHDGLISRDSLESQVGLESREKRKSEKGGERVKAGEDVIKSVAGIVYMLSRILKYSSLLIPTVFILVRIIVTVTSSYLGMITGLRAFGWLNIK